MPRSVAAISAARSATNAAGYAQLVNVTSTDATVLGLGIVQNFNNAATEWYLGYRNFALDLNSDAVCTRGANPNIATKAPATPHSCWARRMTPRTRSGTPAAGSAT